MRARAVSIDPTRHGAILAASPAQSRAGPGRCCLRGVRGVGGVGWSHVGGVGWSHGAGSRMRPRQALEEASAATAAVEASVPAPDDPVISVMFTLAVVALSVLTIGVAYLSISSFLDQRQEEEVRLRLPVRIPWAADISLAFPPIRSAGP